MTLSEQQACASVAEQIGEMVAEHAAKQKHQPAIIEVTRSEGDNQISFAIRGSSEWLNEMMPFVISNLEFIGQRILGTTDPTQCDEMLAGLDALANLKTYEGEFVKVSIAQEATP